LHEVKTFLGPKQVALVRRSSAIGTNDHRCDRFAARAASRPRGFGKWPWGTLDLVISAQES
jgi:hypothetical protein